MPAIDGMVMHGQTAGYCNFPGLEGFKRLHGYRFTCEAISMRRIHRYLTGHCDRLLPVADTRHIDAIPVEWPDFTRQAVESETKPEAVGAGMRGWCGWGHETREPYAKSAKDPYGAGGVAAAHVACGPVRDADDECGYADRSAPSSSAVDYGMQAIVPMRHGPHGKYRKKPHGVGEKPSQGWMETVSIEAVEGETPDLGKRDTPHAVCERPAWPYTARDHPKKPTADATVMERRITDGPTGPEFSKAASNVGYAAPMGVPDDHMPCIEAVCPKQYDAVMSQIHALR